MRIAIVGPGRMGRAVAAAAAERGHQVVAELRAGELQATTLGGADVAMEFTTSGAAADNLRRLAALGLPAVCGTTGWYHQLPDVHQAFARHGVGLVYAPNFSVGAQLQLQLARLLGGMLRGRPEFDAWMVETHHRNKRDTPSGTASALQSAFQEADPGRPLPITSVRAGDVPGTHGIYVDGAGESLTLVHQARDRSIFARGAVTGAEWLHATRPVGAVAFGAIFTPADADR